MPRKCDDYEEEGRERRPRPPPRRRRGRRPIGQREPDQAIGTQRPRRVVEADAQRSRSSSHAAAAPRHPDAISVLKHDHAQLLPLLKELKEITGTRRQRMLEQVQEMLQTHTRVEEEIFYPAFRDAAQNDEDRKSITRRPRSTARRIWRCASSRALVRRRGLLGPRQGPAGARPASCGGGRGGNVSTRTRALPGGRAEALGDEIRARKQTLGQRSGPIGGRRIAVLPLSVGG